MVAISHIEVVVKGIFFFFLIPKQGTVLFSDQRTERCELSPRVGLLYRDHISRGRRQGSRGQAQASCSVPDPVPGAGSAELRCRHSRFAPGTLT